MASLPITVKVAGVLGASLAVAAYPLTAFLKAPQRTSLPSGASTASGTTSSSGTVTLTGLTSATSYYVSVVDARGVHNWFQTGPADVAGPGIVLDIPWTTPATTTGAVDTGGDTPGAPRGTKVFAPLTHVHSIPPAASGVTKGELVFIAAEHLRGAGTGTENWSAGSNPLTLSQVLYDPLSGSDGVGFVVPSTLVGANLWVDCIVEYGGTTAAAAIEAILQIQYTVAPLELAEAVITLPPGNVAWDQSIVLNGSTLPYVPSGGVVFGDVIRLAQNIVTLGIGSAMMWGGVYTGAGFFTQMRIFTC